MSHHIVIVDDSSIIRSMLKKCIGLSGLVVASLREATNGREALSAILEQRPSVLFMDVHMPEMSGLELAEELVARGILPSLPTIVVSSDRNPEHQTRLESFGVRTWIRKPFRPEEIRAAVDGLMKVET